jgi:hypothetical protein
MIAYVAFGLLELAAEIVWRDNEWLDFTNEPVLLD